MASTRNAHIPTSFHVTKTDLKSAVPDSQLPLRDLVLQVWSSHARGENDDTISISDDGVSVTSSVVRARRRRVPVHVSRQLNEAAQKIAVQRRNMGQSLTFSSAGPSYTLGMALDDSNLSAAAQGKVRKAAHALRMLTHSSLKEISSFARPAPLVRLVIEALSILLGVVPPKSTVQDPADHRKFFSVADYWTGAKHSILVDVKALKRSLLDFNCRTVSDIAVAKLAEYTDCNGFDEKSVRAVSKACVPLFLWIDAVAAVAKEIPRETTAMPSACSETVKSPRELVASSGQEGNNVNEGVGSEHQKSMKVVPLNMSRLEPESPKDAAVSSPPLGAEAATFKGDKFLWSAPGCSAQVQRISSKSLQAAPSPRNANRSSEKRVARSPRPNGSSKQISNAKSPRISNKLVEDVSRGPLSTPRRNKVVGSPSRIRSPRRPKSAPQGGNIAENSFTASVPGLMQPELKDLQPDELEGSAWLDSKVALTDEEIYDLELSGLQVYSGKDIGDWLNAPIQSHYEWDTMGRPVHKEVNSYTAEAEQSSPAAIADESAKRIQRAFRRFSETKKSKTYSELYGVTPDWMKKYGEPVHDKEDDDGAQVDEVSSHEQTHEDAPRAKASSAGPSRAMSPENKDDSDSLAREVFSDGNDEIAKRRKGSRGSLVRALSPFGRRRSNENVVSKARPASEEHAPGEDNDISDTIPGERNRANSVASSAVSDVMDSFANRCHGCNKRFTVTRRKHHCRLCGREFCNKCAKKASNIPGQKSKVRVCPTCLQHAMGFSQNIEVGDTEV